MKHVLLGAAEVDSTLERPDPGAVEAEMAGYTRDHGVRSFNLYARLRELGGEIRRAASEAERGEQREL